MAKLLTLYVGLVLVLSCKTSNQQIQGSKPAVQSQKQTVAKLSEIKKLYSNLGDQFVAMKGDEAKSLGAMAHAISNAKDEDLKLYLDSGYIEDARAMNKGQSEGQLELTEDGAAGSGGQNIGASATLLTFGIISMGAGAAGIRFVPKTGGPWAAFGLGLAAVVIGAEGVAGNPDASQQGKNLLLAAGVIAIVMGLNSTVLGVSKEQRVLQIQRLVAKMNGADAETRKRTMFEIADMDTKFTEALGNTVNSEEGRKVIDDRITEIRKANKDGGVYADFLTESRNAILEAKRQIAFEKAKVEFAYGSQIKEDLFVKMAEQTKTAGVFIKEDRSLTTGKVEGARDITPKDLQGMDDAQFKSFNRRMNLNLHPDKFPEKMEFFQIYDDAIKRLQEVNQRLVKEPTLADVEFKDFRAPRSSDYLARRRAVLGKLSLGALFMGFLVGLSQSDVMGLSEDVQDPIKVTLGKIDKLL